MLAIILYYLNFSGILIVRPRDVVLAGGGGCGGVGSTLL